MPTAIPFKNISIKITYVIYHYLYFITSTLNKRYGKAQQLYRGSEVQSPWTGLILSSLLRPPIARCRTRPPSRPSQLHGPLQDEVLSTVLSIALYRTRSSSRPSPLPSTGPGPLHILLKQEDQPFPGRGPTSTTAAKHRLSKDLTSAYTTTADKLCNSLQPFAAIYFYY